MPIAQVNGTTLNYMQLSYKGSGETEDLVMIHGLAANMGFWLQDFAHHFSQRFRVTLVDLRGHGRSGTTPSGYNPENLAADLQSLLAHLEIKKAHIIAHSFGGVVAMHLAADNPALMSSLVLADTQISVGREQAQGTPWEIGGTIQKILDECNINLDTRHPYFGYQVITEVAKYRRDDKVIPEALYPWVGRMLDGNSKRTSERWLQLMEETTAEQELMGNDGLAEEKLLAICCPVLAMYGEKSHAMSTGRYLTSLWKQAEFISVPNGGHFFPKAHPDAVKSYCDNFWDGAPC